MGDSGQRRNEDLRRVCVHRRRRQTPSGSTRSRSPDEEATVTCEKRSCSSMSLHRPALSRDHRQQTDGRAHRVRRNLEYSCGFYQTQSSE